MNRYCSTNNPKKRTLNHWKLFYSCSLFQEQRYVNRIFTINMKNWRRLRQIGKESMYDICAYLERTSNNRIKGRITKNVQDRKIIFLHQHFRDEKCESHFSRFIKITDYEDNSIQPGYENQHIIHRNLHIENGRR